jgi:hypothetical protein
VDNDVELIKKLSQSLSESGVVLVNVPINEVWQDPKHIRKYDLAYVKKLMMECDLNIISIQETDKLTSFFLKEEKVKRAGVLKLSFTKAMRVFFGVMPLQVMQIFEKLFLKQHRNQQLIVLAVKI